MRAVQILREQARLCTSKGYRETARNLESAATTIEFEADKEDTDPLLTVRVCANCGHATPTKWQPPRG